MRNGGTRAQNAISLPPNVGLMVLHAIWIGCIGAPRPTAARPTATRVALYHTGARIEKE